MILTLIAASWKEGIEAFLFNQRSFDEMLDLASKSIEALKFRQDTSQEAKPSKSCKLSLKREGSNFKREAGRLEFQKRSGFLKGECGRQEVVYMEGALIVGLVSFHLFPMHK